MTVPGFLTKTFDIFSNPEYADCCGWGVGGDTIVIRKIETFSREILPKYFKHSNFQSFVRQLNMYDFHKTVQDPTHGEFQHQYFKKGKPELLIHIKRKANRASDNLKKLKTLSNAASDYSTNNETTQLPNRQNTDNHNNNTTQNQPNQLIQFNPLSAFTMDTNETINNNTSNNINNNHNMNDPYNNPNNTFERRMESKLAQVEAENLMLKRLFVESHHQNTLMQERMERVLKTLYSIFIGNNGSNQLNGLPLMNRLPSVLLADLQAVAEGSSNSDSNALSTAMSTFLLPTNNITKGNIYDTSNVVMDNGNNAELLNLDINSLSRLPSLDITGLNTPASDIFRLNSLNSIGRLEEPASYLLSSQGQELGSVPKGTSFDHAASSVSVPLKYAAALDNSIFPSKRQYSIEQNPNGFEGNALKRKLSTDGAYEDKKEKKNFQNDTNKIRRLNAKDGNYEGRNVKNEADLNNSLPPITKETEGVFPPEDRELFDAGQKLHLLRGHSDTAIDSAKRNKFFSNGDRAQSSIDLKKSIDLGSASGETQKFFDLYNKNQQNTLTRLDSLEQTISSLLEIVDNEDVNSNDQKPDNENHNNSGEGKRGGNNK